MTQQEQELLNGLIGRVNGTQLPSKDEEAERLLRSALGNNPDALYILSQTVLVQQFAMDNAQRQLTEARAEIERLKATPKAEEHGSFLGNLFGLGKSDNETRPQAPAPPASQAGYAGAPTGYSPVNNPVPLQYGSPQPPQAQPGYGYGQPGYGYGQPGYGGGMPMGGGMFGGGGGMFGGGGGFLQGAMQTAAGVVAGEFAFKAIEGMFHGGGHGFGGGSEVVNNYYDNDSSSAESGGFGDRLRDADGLGNGISPDIEDRRGEAHGFFGSADDGGNDSSSFADSGASDFSNDGGSFDGGSFDSGSFDSGDSGNDDNGF